MDAVEPDMGDAGVAASCAPWGDASSFGGSSMGDACAERSGNHWIACPTEGIAGSVGRSTTHQLVSTTPERNRIVKKVPPFLRRRFRRATERPLSTSDVIARRASRSRRHHEHSIGL